MKNPEEKEDQLQAIRSKLLVKVIPIVQKNGFHALRIEEMAKCMDVSKATMYKYFRSKDEIVESLVDRYVTYIREVDSDIADRNIPLATRFQKVFEQAVLMVVYVSEVFLKDLDMMYPAFHEKISEALWARSKRLAEFYGEGVQNGDFHPCNPHLLILQDETFLRQLIDPKFLLQHQLTLNQALHDYYLLRKHQLFKPERLSTLDNEAMCAKIDYLAAKISRGL